MSLDLETAYHPPTVPEWIMAIVCESPAVHLSPGDTLEIEVSLQNGQRLRLGDAPVPVVDYPHCSASFG